MFFSLFFTLDMAFFFLALQHQVTNAGTAAALGKTGGAFGIIAAILAWYNMFAGIADDSNFFFRVTAIPFPWSDGAREKKAAREHEA